MNTRMILLSLSFLCSTFALACFGTWAFHQFWSLTTGDAVASVSLLWLCLTGGSLAIARGEL